ncbi:hypothetical protein ACH5RR_018079 [Cinchona calisaya]|uniref:TCP domain-containing protein n=1 Tax=Cinchona calisaya TaxID=153742 RepID=A0ABD2ZP13_9GENT
MHGGRIVRSAGRKDRHSKVSTARGPRDRRVRLSPTTAIQFYDVQDRLGYDRPSNAIDWLMKEAKAAIDALDHQDSSNATTANLEATTILMQPRNSHLPEKGLEVLDESTNCSRSVCGIDSQEYLNGNNFSSFSMENDGFQIYPHVGDLGTSRNIRSQTQGLSLSFHTTVQQDFSFPFSSAQDGLIPPAFTPSNCDSETNSEMAICQRILGWNSNSNNQFFHRESLKSSFSPPISGPLVNQFPDLYFPGTRISSDNGLSKLSAAARIQGLEEQNPISGEPSSATSLLNYQD